MKDYYHYVSLLFLCLLLVSPVFADNTTMAGSTLKPFLQCGAGITSANVCVLPNGEFPELVTYAGTSSRTWDGTSAGKALVGVFFEVQYDSITDFTMITYANQTITGQIQTISGLIYSTRILTLNSQSKTFESIDLWVNSFGSDASHRFYISMYALNITTNEEGIVLYDAGLIGSIKTGTATSPLDRPEDIISGSLSNENVYVTIENLAPIRIITFSSNKPDTISFWYTDASYVADILNAMRQPEGVAGEYLKVMEQLLYRIFPNLIQSYVTFADLIVELILNIPVIFVLYEVIVSLLAFFTCGGNIFKGIAAWWRAQKAFVVFVFYGLEVIEDHWQAFAIASAVVIIGKIAGWFYGLAHFITLGAV